MKIDLNYGSDAYRQFVSDQLPSELMRAGVDPSAPWFYIQMLHGAYPEVDVVGPNSFGHPRSARSGCRR